MTLASVSNLIRPDAPDFEGYPKTPRLFRNVVITEKIDGTNAAVRITDDGAVWCQSRNRIITPDDDNFGFAEWAASNAGALVDTLGPGLHFGEWWGSGIQRGYDQIEKHFSLFNVHRWQDQAADLAMVPNLGVVPVLYRGLFDTDAVDYQLMILERDGSQAAPGFMRPEGVIVYHAAARQVFKALLENDHQAKGAEQVAA